jgi:putative PEP-CTERM system histidine kinase
MMPLLDRGKVKIPLGDVAAGEMSCRPHDAVVICCDIKPMEPLQFSVDAPADHQTHRDINPGVSHMLATFLTITAISLALAWPLGTLFRKDRTLATYVLFVAMVITATVEAADFCLYYFPERLFFWKQIAVIAESCQAPAWLFYSLVFSRERELSSVSLAQKIIFPLTLSLIGFALYLPVHHFFYSPDFNAEQMLFLTTTGFYFYVGIMVTLVIALINLEATLSGATTVSRWKIRLEVVGTGGLLAILIFYYSQGLLYRTLDMHLVPVRSLAIIVAVVLIASSHMRGGTGVKVVLSRQMAYRSFVLLAIGIYLIFIGIMGEGLQYFGESFQRSALVMVSFLAAIGLFLFILSDKAKRKLTLFLTRNFYKNKHDYRSQWLEFTERISSAHSNQEVLLAILSVYCDNFGMGSAALFLCDAQRKTFFHAASMELDVSRESFAADNPIVLKLWEDRKVMNLGDGYGMEGLEGGGMLSSLGLCFLIPLMSNNLLDGFIMLGKQINPDEHYNCEDFDLMQTLAQQASSALLNMRLTDELALAKQMEALGRIATFIIHDLKNLVYTISLTLDNARTYILDTEFQQDMLETLGNTVSKMNALISRLNTIPDQKKLPRKNTDLMQLIKETVALVKRCEVTIFGTSVTAPVDRQEIQKVFLNLILNAVEATDGQGPVSVEVGLLDIPFVKVIDGGCGMPEEFIRTKLFTPFQTTKKNGLGIGLYQCKQIVENHQGRIEVSSIANKGTAFTIWLPLH